jgi:hypothetical protein
MQKFIRILAIVVLIFNGISGLAGGYGLTADPSGAGVQMPIYLLDGSPFHNFLIPGLVLLVFIGISSLVVAYLAIKKDRRYPLLLIYQGITVWIWLIVEIMVIGTLDALQLVYAIVGLILVLSGVIEIGLMKGSLSKNNTGTLSH